jgi:geranylgeranyl transferase type-1 subunit beta
MGPDLGFVAWLTPVSPSQSTYESEFDTPHMIVTYTALIALAILRDDFTRLDRRGLVTFLRSSQQEDGRFVFVSIIIF